MAAYTFVAGDDWCGLYADGKLVHDGHSIPEIAMLRLVKAHGPVTSYEFVEADYEWLDERGDLPMNLSAVKVQ